MRDLPADSPRKLFVMGLVTNLLNPKVAILYMSLLPQFIDPARGSVLLQSLVLGFTQIVIGVTGNGLIALSAGTIALFLAGRPFLDGGATLAHGHGAGRARDPHGDGSAALNIRKRPLLRNPRAARA